MFEWMVIGYYMGISSKAKNPAPFKMEYTPLSRIPERLEMWINKSTNLGGGVIMDEFRWNCPKTRVVYVVRELRVEDKA